VRGFVIASTFVFVFAQADDVVDRDHLLQRGKEDYRAARYDAAIDELRSAASQFVGPDERQLYIDTGSLPTVPQFEQSLIYLALAHAKLGRDNEARDAIERLLSAERISAVYKTLPLDRDAADFEPLAARLIPAAALPANDQLAQLGITATTPATPQTSVTEERTALSRAIQEQIVEEAMPPVLPRKTPAPVVVEEPKEKKAASIVTTAKPSSLVAMLRRAESAAIKGNVDEATGLFIQVATASNATRDEISAAAAGLYRVSDYNDAVDAFNRLGTFARGEEDLRYYDAVSLYEAGRYDEARRQLACALPYIEASEDVTRYRAKIEQTATRASLQ